MTAYFNNLYRFRKLRQKDVSKFHIQLCCALIGMLLVFAIGIDRTESFGGCVTVSVLIHYFTLVAVMWMGAEALLMLQKIVIVFVRITTRYIIAVSIICWGNVCMGHYIHVHVNVFFVPYSRSVGSCANSALNR